MIKVKGLPTNTRDNWGGKIPTTCSILSVINSSIWPNTSCNLGFAFIKIHYRDLTLVAVAEASWLCILENDKVYITNLERIYTSSLLRP